MGGSAPAASAAPSQPRAERAQPAPPLASRPAAANGHTNRIFASPLARRMAHQAGLDLGAIVGSGPQGRIVKSDIEAALTAAQASPIIAK